MRRRPRLLLGLAALLACISSAPASAGTVADASGGTLIFEAGTGEANQLTITEALDSSSFTVVDSGAPLVAAGGCVASDAQTAVCPAGGRVEVILGDLSDEAVIVTKPFTDVTARIVGGQGDDAVTLTSSVHGLSTVEGGPGDDTLTVPNGRAYLWGHEGDDTLDAHASDTFVGMVGGAGGDTFEPGPFSRVSYWKRTSAVLVDADGAADDGAPGESDNLLPIPDGFVTVFGGGGADRMRAGGGVETVVGGPGPDRLETGDAAFRPSALGGPGRDRLVGGNGIDDLHGGNGDDVLTGDRASDFLRGGWGDDVLKGGRGPDSLYGDSGDDFLAGGLGHDDALGDFGRDTFLMRDAQRDRVRGGRDRDRARIDRGLDNVRQVEAFF